MDAERQTALTHQMARLAAGDMAFVFTLLDTFGIELRRTVTGILGSMGRRDALADRDFVDGLVVDTAMIIFDHAPAWRAGGAPPWVWAHHAIRAHVVTAVGHAIGGTEEDLEAEVSGAGLPSTVDPGVELLLAMADHDERIALLVELVDDVLTPLHARIFLEFQLLKAMNCAAASQTVARMYDKSDANVRQIKKRALDKIRPALADPRYAPIADLPILAA